MILIRYKLDGSVEIKNNWLVVYLYTFEPVKNIIHTLKIELILSWDDVKLFETI